MDIEGLIDGYVGTSDEGLQRLPVFGSSSYFGDEFREREPSLRGALLKQGGNLIGKS